MHTNWRAPCAYLGNEFSSRKTPWSSTERNRGFVYDSKLLAEEMTTGIMIDELNRQAMTDFIAENWNDGLTLLLAGITILIGYYQVRHYRAQQADVNILSTADETYEWRTRDPAYGDLQSVDDSDEAIDTKYSLTVTVENDGRSPTTISEFILHLPATEEELQMYNEHGRREWQRSFVELSANDRREVSLFVAGNPREEYGDDVPGILQIDTTTGVIEAEVTFSTE